MIPREATAGAATRRGSLAEVAAWYARRRWSVLPVFEPLGGGCTCPRGPSCDRPGKHPRLSDGVRGATRNVATTAAWWHEWPSANVAIATGKPSGLWVLDVDGACGMASMRELEARNGKVPVTVTADTGGGGLHLFWKLPAGLIVPSRVRVLPGVDVRGDGGYAILPPSGHATGKRYAWHDGRGPHQVPIAEAPGWLLSVALGRDNGHGHERQPWGALFRARVPESERNHALAQRAGYLLRLGVDREATSELLIAWSRTHCAPPLPDGEVKRTVTSIARSEDRKESNHEHK
ncbi:MAG: bifunctional DNA primase/polymerase [Deltaproteobacteria bacterium]|nr:bifunctional DNA primase/polymerase [Deltaproteobacteria bacterium]